MQNILEIEKIIFRLMSKRKMLIWKNANLEITNFVAR